MEPGDLVLVRQKAFKGKHKISDRWENNPYYVIEYVGRHLLVYKVQLIGQATKIRILHRHLLFPLSMRNEGDEKQQNIDKKEPKLADREKENVAPSVENADNYEGPITRSKTKKNENALLLKANVLMSNHFNDEWY